MQGIAGVAIGLLVVASIAVGVRLLALHRRTGGAPELMLGGMLLLSVGVGYPSSIASSLAIPPWVVVLQVVANLAFAAGYSLLLAFTWRVFRPESGLARALTAAGVLMMFLRAVLRSIQVATTGRYDIADRLASEILLQGVPTIGAYCWTAWESLRYHGLMRRRVRLGLADPAVCNRFLLWGLMALVVIAGIGVNLAALDRHVDVFQSPWVLLLSSATGLTQVVLLVLTFLPPTSYLSWIRARAAAGSA